MLLSICIVVLRDVNVHGRSRARGLRETAQTSGNKLPKVARGALLGAHFRPQTVQMLLAICNFVPRAVHMHGACGNQREPAELNYQKWPEQPFLEPMSAHKTAIYTCVDVFI